jgi:DNA-binding transcriptional MerR regulator
VVESDNNGWRIDDLAQRAKVSVDTIRFYLREGLLPPARRIGRLTLFGPAHLARLQQVRELQARHFNLGAIRQLIENDRLGIIETLFSAEEGSYTRDELVEASGLDEAVVARLEAVGYLADPAAEGRETYDNADLQALRAVAALIEIGLPADVVVDLAAIHVRHFEALHAEVGELFEQPGDRWPPGTWEAFQTDVDAKVRALLSAAERLAGYVRQRTLQRMTLSLLREHSDEA